MGYLGLVDEDLDLVYLYGACELDDDVLGEDTEALALPSFDIVWVLAG